MLLNLTIYYGSQSYMNILAHSTSAAATYFKTYIQQLLPRSPFFTVTPLTGCRDF